MWNTLTGTLSYIWPDVWYWQCVSYILYPAIITFSIVPLFLIGYFTYAAVYVHLYRYMRGRRKASEDDFWHDAGTRILSFWSVYARIWHGESISCIYPKYSDRQIWANSVDPDQTPHNAASDQGSTLFANHPAVLDASRGSKMGFKFWTSVDRSQGVWMP